MISPALAAQWPNGVLSCPPPHESECSSRGKSSSACALFASHGGAAPGLWSVRLARVGRDRGLAPASDRRLRVRPPGAMPIAGQDLKVRGPGSTAYICTASERRERPHMPQTGSSAAVTAGSWPCQVVSRASVNSASLWRWLAEGPVTESDLGLRAAAPDVGAGALTVPTGVGSRVSGRTLALTRCSDQPRCLLSCASLPSRRAVLSSTVMNATPTARPRSAPRSLPSSCLLRRPGPRRCLAQRRPLSVHLLAPPLSWRELRDLCRAWRCASLRLTRRRCATWPARSARRAVCVPGVLLPRVGIRLGLPACVPGVLLPGVGVPRLVLLDRATDRPIPA